MSQTPTAKEALDGRIVELRKQDKLYSSLAYRTHWMLWGAGVLTFVLGMGGALLGFVGPESSCKTVKIIIKIIQGMIPLVTPAAALWAIKLHALYGLRTSGFNDYRALLRYTELEGPMAKDDVGHLYELHKKINGEMREIDKRQEAQHLAILQPGSQALSLPKKEK